MRLANCVLLCSSLLFSHAAAAAELPQRWVSSGGSLSEWVVRLGGEGRLVGVDTTSLHPQSLRQLPSVGYQRALPAEGVLSLRPDILIGSEEMGPPPVVATTSTRPSGVTRDTVPRAISTRITLPSSIATGPSGKASPDAISRIFMTLSFGAPYSTRMLSARISSPRFW